MPLMKSNFQYICRLREAIIPGACIRYCCYQTEGKMFNEPLLKPQGLFSELAIGCRMLRSMVVLL